MTSVVSLLCAQPFAMFVCHASRWQWGPETRIPAGFYPIRGRGWTPFHPRGAVAGHIIQPDMFRGCTPVSVVLEPETRNPTIPDKIHLMC